jgi:cytidyltransferase-like protein
MVQILYPIKSRHNFLVFDSESAGFLAEGQGNAHWSKIIITFPKRMKIVHNFKIDVTKQTYSYVFAYKQQLFQELVALFEQYSIPYVISDGNLLEYERNIPIYHDDDIDLRVECSSFMQFETIVKSTVHNRILFESCGPFWWHASLRSFQKPNPDFVVFDMKLYADIVASDQTYYVWKPYDIDFRNLRKIVYLYSETYAPSVKDTIRVLTNEYGAGYIRPNYRLYDLVDAEQKKKPRIHYADMCADLLHYGHIEFLKQIFMCKEEGDLIYIGVHSDETIQSYKRTPIFTMKERIRVLESVKYIDKIVPNAPLRITKEFLEEHAIDRVYIPNNRTKEEIQEWLEYPNQCNMIRILTYTPEISTTDIIARIRNDCVVGNTNGS